MDTVGHSSPRKRILVVTAVAPEQDSVIAGLNGDLRFEVLAAGVGPAAAAAATAAALAAAPRDLVISAGIGGGFPGRAPVGSLVVATELVAADLGAETPEGFCSLEELGLGLNRVGAEASLVQGVEAALATARLPVVAGPVLTVSTVTGTAAGAAAMARRAPGAAAEAMEGYGVAVAAQAFGLPVLEIRAVSNLVGPRDREAWRIPEALALLEAAFAIIREVL